MTRIRGHVLTRKSVSGYIVLLGSSPTSWKSKKWPAISKSSLETEYRAVAHATVDVTWLVMLLTELGTPNLQLVAIHCDNQSALHIARNPVFHERTKHIDIDYHLTREKLMKGLI